jgi:hypothetical protein
VGARAAVQHTPCAEGGSVRPGTAGPGERQARHSSSSKARTHAVELAIKQARPVARQAGHLCQAGLGAVSERLRVGQQRDIWREVRVGRVTNMQAHPAALQLGWWCELCFIGIGQPPIRPGCLSDQPARRDIKTLLNPNHQQRNCSALTGRSHLNTKSLILLLSSLSSHASASSPAEPSTTTRPPPGSGDSQHAPV